MPWHLYSSMENTAAITMSIETVLRISLGPMPGLNLLGGGHRNSRRGSQYPKEDKGTLDVLSINSRTPNRLSRRYTDHVE